MRRTEFEGPRGRYWRALYELENPSVKPSKDVWVIKLKQMLRQRKDYDPIRYAEEQPLYYGLFGMFENDSVNSPKHMLEAMLVTGASFSDVAGRLKDPAIPDGLVVGLYHELFYNIHPYLESTPMMYRYVVQPLIGCVGSELPMGAIWKLLAYCGGVDVLEASGFGTRPVTPEDIAYLIQLGGYRNAAMMLSYISEGSAFVQDNPVAANIVFGLTELANKSGNDRDKMGFKAITVKADTDYSQALTGLFRMVYEEGDSKAVSLTTEQKLIECKPVKFEDE